MALTPPGIIIVLLFIGLPFVIRTVQPVLGILDHSLEEAAATLGADRLQVLLCVLLPALTSALLPGFAVAFARGLDKYGSMFFMAVNLPMVSEVALLLIVVKLAQYDYVGATSIAMAMLAISFLLLLAVNLLRA